MTSERVINPAVHRGSEREGGGGNYTRAIISRGTDNSGNYNPCTGRHNFLVADDDINNRRELLRAGRVGVTDGN